jgi:hypothetical protein
MFLNVRGRKLSSVLTCKSAKAGKLKLAGAREKMKGMVLLKSPVAWIRGVSELNEKLGTRGMVKAKMSAILEHDLIVSTRHIRQSKIRTCRVK